MTKNSLGMYVSYENINYSKLDESLIGNFFVNLKKDFFSIEKFFYKTETPC